MRSTLNAAALRLLVVCLGGLTAGALACSGGQQSSSGFGLTPGDSVAPSPGPMSPGTDAGAGNDASSTGLPSFADQSDASQDVGPQCVNLECQQHTCAGGATTTISGTIYDPAAKNPLYNVVVYVPNATPQPFPAGASCDTCSALYTGSPLVTALTDANGNFTLTNAPAGANVPLVIQVGKWRTQTTIPMVQSCAANPLPDKSLTLPKNHTVGDIPNIAIATGGADTLECLLSRIGLDAAEYGPGSTGPGRLHIYQGDGGPNTSPAAPVASQSLWDSSTDLMQYDIVLLSCEGHETTSMNQQVLFNYAAAGGRVFGSHFHYAWFNTGPFGSANLATWHTGDNDMGNINATIETTLPNGQPFPKGLALQQWLGNVNALTNGELPIQEAKHNADVSASNTPSTSWIVSDQSANPAGATEYLSFDTPIGAAPASQCGRVVFSDLHVGAASGDNPGKPVPQECAANNLSPQEKALEFMLFDLSSCVTPDDTPPIPPPPSMTNN